MQTRLTTLLGIKYPIIQGGMAWVSDSKLAGAVSNAGGAGIIGSGGRTTEWVKEEINKIKLLTDKPFGVNVMLMAPNKDEVVDVICQEKVSFVTLGAGNPVPYIKKFQEAGIKVIPVVPNLKLAMRIETSGADAMVVEGMEAGGHIGTLTTMALMTNVLPKIGIPVIVAGGIADGRGIAAALMMGAAGVQIGSRFIMTSECPMHANAKAKILAATDTDSVVTGYSRGHGVRGLRNKFTDAFMELERKGAPQEELDRISTGTNRLAACDGDVDNGLVQVGQSLVVLDKIQSVQDAVEEMMKQTVECLTSAGSLVKSI